MGTLKHKISDINNGAANKTTNQPVTLYNEATLDTAIFASATPAAASSVAPYDHFLSSGLKLDTKLFSQGNINNVVDKGTIYSTPSPGAPKNEYDRTLIYVK